MCEKIPFACEFCNKEFAMGDKVFVTGPDNWRVPTCQECRDDMEKENHNWKTLTEFVGVWDGDEERMAFALSGAEDYARDGDRYHSGTGESMDDESYDRYLNNW